MTTTPPATVTLWPLNDGELNYCLNLLKADLKRSAESRLFRSSLGQLTIDSLSGKPGAIQSPVTFTREIAKAKHWEWETNVADCLMKAQRVWRHSVHGPHWVNVHEENATDFDTFQLAGASLERFRIPQFSLDVQRMYGGRRKFHPVVKPTMRTVEDIFNWFLVRAVINAQLSRFSHCLVCGRWELKKIAGQRSVKVYNVFKRHQHQDSGKRNDASKIPKYCWAFPMWPGLCSKDTCRSKFNSIFPDRKRKRPRSRFDPRQFLGLRV